MLITHVDGDFFSGTIKTDECIIELDYDGPGHWGANASFGDKLTDLPYKSFCGINLLESDDGCTLFLSNDFQINYYNHNCEYSCNLDIKITFFSEDKENIHWNISI